MKRETAAYQRLKKDTWTTGSTQRLGVFFFFVSPDQIWTHNGSGKNFSQCASTFKESKVCDLKENGSSLGEKENIDINTLSASTCTDATDLLVWGGY